MTFIETGTASKPDLEELSPGSSSGAFFALDAGNRQAKLAMYTNQMAMTSLDNDDPLKVYIRELGTIRPLAKDEEADLWRHVRTQDEQAESAGTRLIEANLSLVVSITERHSSGGIQILDLIQEGNLALSFALKTFTGSSGDSFSSHAANCIEYAVSKAIAESQSGDN